MATNAETSVIKEPRRLKQRTYKRWRLNKRIKHPGPKLPSSWRLLKQSLTMVWANRRIFLGVLAVYTVLSLVLVKGLANSSNLAAIKDSLQTETSMSKLDQGVTLLNELFNAGISTNGEASIYQTILVVIMSLVVIWVLRQVYSEPGKKLKLKASFYNSTTPLIPFLMVVFTISIQLVPFLLGSAIYTTVTANGLAVTGIEKLAWGGAFFVLTLWSFYMVTASIFGLYIVTLPETLPRQALKSARQLVRYRRWTVMRKLIIMPIALLLLLSIIVLPIAIWLTPLAEPIFFILSLAAVLAAHAYVYNLYREML